MPDARVFSIPPDAPFLPTLVDALLEGRLLPGLAAGDATALADATIYLPTRRAARAFRLVLGERLGGRPHMLPRIVPLGDAEEADFDPASAWSASAHLEPDLRPPPLPPLERRLILTRLIQQWSRALDDTRRREAPERPRLVPSSPADAVALAGELEGLMDQLAVEGVPWDEIATAVDAEFSRYFETTLAFVRIASESWPAILRERGASDPTRRRNAVILAEARRLAEERPEAPIVAAGSTGSVPATAALLAAIAGLPNGAVVLPGLDLHLDAASWDAIGGGDGEEAGPVHGHPQALLRRLLVENLQIGRDAVRELAPSGPRDSGRTTLLSEAMRPAETTDRWAEEEPGARERIAREGGRGLAVIEAADEREEALAVAVALRETLAEPGRTAALVTPDRQLAKRVAVELRRWDVAVEDSAGLALSESGAGRLARLAAEAAARDFHPAALLALLAHPALRLGMRRADLDRGRAALEIGVLRGPMPRPGLDGLAAALEARRKRTRRASRPERRLEPADWNAASDVVRRLKEAYRGFTLPDWPGEQGDLIAIADRHAHTLEQLGAGAAGDAADDAAEEAVFALFDELAAGGERGTLTGRFADYPAFFARLAAERTLSQPVAGGHPRIAILGLLEARLLAADRIVLGGLDEGIWPPVVETGAFLNRPMRAKLGLSPPERRIGQTAHDFVQAMGGADVVITRARKREGRPMVRSRFLERLKAFGGDGAWADLVVGGERYRALAQALERPQRVPQLRAPRPKPEPRHFPRRLSVTEIEVLVRDPYSIFAKHILRLEALDPIAVPPGAADRGTLVHDVLGEFTKDFPLAMPADAHAILMARAERAFADIEEAFPELYAQWWPRFVRVLPEYLGWEEERRRGITAIHAERSGSLAIPLADGSALTLRARADRIEERADGTFAIIDFKTGSVPTNRVVAVGFSPQLTLEAAMLLRGAFTDIPAAATTPDLLYVKIGGVQKALEPIELKPPPKDARSMAEIVREQVAGLAALAAGYVSGEAVYLSRPYAQYARRYSDYDHLARVKEWSATGGTDDEAESE